MAITIQIEVKNDTEEGALESLALVAEQIRKGYTKEMHRTSKGYGKLELTGEEEVG